MLSVSIVLLLLTHNCYTTLVATRAAVPGNIGVSLGPFHIKTQDPGITCSFSTAGHLHIGLLSFPCHAPSVHVTIVSSFANCRIMCLTL